MGLFLVPNASLLLGSYITTWEGQFSPHSYGKKWESLCRLLIKKFLVKISQNLPPLFWHGTQPGPHTSANALFGLGLRKYYVLAISVSNFITLSAFLLSIRIIFPVRLIMEGVLEPLRTEGRTDILKSPLCSTGHRPFGATAQKGEDVWNHRSSIPLESLLILLIDY